MTKLSPNIIRTDGGTQPRARLDADTVDRYTAAMQRGAQFPALVVYYDGERHWLADGFHRLAAHKRAHGSQVDIWVDVFQGTVRDARLYSAGANDDHGLQRSADDKERAVVLLLKDEEWGQWSDRAIADKCRVSHPFVGKIRARLLEAGEIVTGNVSSERAYVDKHGNQATMNTAAIGRNQKRILPEDMQPHVEAFIADYEDHHGRAFAELDNPAHSNSVFWRDVTRYFRSKNIPYAEGGLKFIVKQLHAQTRSGSGGSQETAEAEETTAVAFKVGDRVTIIGGGWQGKTGQVLSATPFTAVVECQLEVTYPDGRPSELRQSSASLALDWLEHPTSRTAPATPGLFLGIRTFPQPCPIGRAKPVNGANCGGCFHYRYTSRGTYQCEEPTWLESQNVLNGEQTAGYQPNFAPIHELETLIRDWLVHVRTGGRTLVVHHAIMESAKKGGKNGTEFKRIVDWLFGRNVFRINDLWQAVNNVHDQLTQQIASRTAEPQPIGSSAQETDGAAQSPSAPQFMAGRIEAETAERVEAARPLAAKIAAAADPRIEQVRNIVGQVDKLMIYPQGLKPDHPESRFFFTLNEASQALLDAIAVLKNKEATPE